MKEKKASKKSAKGEIFVVVEFLGEWCHWMAVGGTQGAWKIQRYETMDLPQGNSQPLKEHLAAFKNKENPPSAIVILPRPQVIFRELKVPTLDANELRQMVDLQVDNLNPNLSRADVVYGYLWRPAGDGASSLVLLHLVKRELVKEWIVLLKEAGFVVKQVVLGSEAIARLSWEWLKKNQQEKIIAIVDVNRWSTELMVLQKGEILFSRAINVGGQDLSDQKVTTDRFADDLIFTLMAYQRGKMGPEIEQVILTGSSTIPAAELASKLTENLSIAVQSVSLIELITPPQSIEGIETVTSREASLTSLAGGVVFQKEFKMDFFPEDVRWMEQRRHFKRSLIFSALLIGILLIIWGLVVSAWIQRDRYLVNGLTNAIQQMKPVAMKLQTQKKQLALVKVLAAKRTSALEALRSLQEEAPKEVFLSLFEYDAGSFGVTLDGTSGSLTEVFNYVTHLKGSKVFSGVNLKYANKKKSAQGEVSDFRIEMKLVPEKL